MWTEVNVIVLQSLEEVELTQFTVPKAAPDLSSTTDLPSAQKKNSYILR